MQLTFACEFKYGDLWWCADANRDPDRSKTSIDVELRLRLLEPAFNVGSNQPAGRNVLIHEFERHLAAMSVAGNAQVNSQLGCSVKRVWIMTQEDIDGV